MAIRKRRPEPIILSKTTRYSGGVDLSSYSTVVAPDAISIKATNVINGEQILTIIYPVQGANSTAFGVGLLVYVRVNNYQRKQIYRIFSVRKTMNNQRIEIKAEPIFNDVRHFTIPLLRMKQNITARNFWQGMLQEMRPRVSTTSSGQPDAEPFYFPFRFLDSTSGHNRIKPVNLVLANGLEALGGKESSMLDTFGGGEFIKDNYDINFRDRIGRDNGIVIAYGLNLKDVDFSMDTSETYWAVICWVQREGEDGQPTIGRSEAAYSRSEYANYSTRVKLVEVQPEEIPEVGGLNTLAWNYLSDHPEILVPKTSLKVDFVSLEGKEGYEEYQQLQEVQLGDTVTIKYKEFGLDLKTRVVSYEYDVITAQYTKMELADTRRSFVNQYRAAYSEVYNQAFNTRSVTVNVQP